MTSIRPIRLTSATRAGRRAGSASPSPTASAPLLHGLQRSLGNRAVQHLLQAKLAVSQPDDLYEREADRVADSVMRMPDPAAAPGSMEGPPASASIQRMCAGCEEEIQRDRALEEEEEPPLMRTEGGGADLDVRAGEIEPYLSSLSGKGQPLPESTRAYMEPRFGADLSGVRVHTDSHAAESARAVNALAFTVGRDIVFSAGTYAPESESGRRLMAHELTHVVQQGAAVPPRVQAQTKSPLPFTGEHPSGIKTVQVVCRPLDSSAAFCHLRARIGRHSYFLLTDSNDNKSTFAAYNDKNGNLTAEKNGDPFIPPNGCGGGTLGSDCLTANLPSGTTGDGVRAALEQTVGVSYGAYDKFSNNSNLWAQNRIGDLGLGVALPATAITSLAGFCTQLPQIKQSVHDECGFASTFIDTTLLTLYGPNCP